MKLTVRIPDLDRAIELSVEPGTWVLLGRRPGSADVRAQGIVPAGDVITAVTVDSPGISKNHALVRVGRDGPMVIHDLRSRHGTSVRVPRDAPVVVDATEAHIDLASSASKRSSMRAPPEARWSGVSDFAEGVRQAIHVWLGGGIEVTIGRTHGAREFASFTLADGSELSLATSPDGDTHLVMLKDVIETLRRWVSEQNAILSQEQGHGEGFILASPAIPPGPPRGRRRGRARDERGAHRAHGRREGGAGALLSPPLRPGRRALRHVPLPEHGG
ncbi:MAG: FHA domain-containing protein [Minicystis sp.]